MISIHKENTISEIIRQYNLNRIEIIDQNGQILVFYSPCNEILYDQVSTLTKKVLFLNKMIGPLFYQIKELNKSFLLLELISPSGEKDDSLEQEISTLQDSSSYSRNDQVHSY